MSKGCSIQEFKSGTSIKGLADYILKKPLVEIINANCGFTASDITSRLVSACRKNPKLKKSAGHISISLPPTTQPRTSDEWRLIVDALRRLIKLPDSFAYVAVRHSDTKNDHLHIAFSKVDDSGKSWRGGGNLGYKLPKIEEEITNKFGLPPTPADQYATKGHINKNEIEWQVSIQTQAPSLVIRSAIARASSVPIDIQDYISLLADEGITVRPNLKLGELNGLSYAYDGISYTGKAVGANWKDLKGAVNYDKHRDSETLAQLKSEIDNRKKAVGDKPVDSSHHGAGTTPVVPGTTISEGDRGYETSEPVRNSEPDCKVDKSGIGSPADNRLGNTVSQRTRFDNLEFTTRSRHEIKAIEQQRRRAKPLEEQLRCLEEAIQRPLERRKGKPLKIYRRVWVTAYLFHKRLVDRIRALYGKRLHKIKTPSNPLNTGFSAVNPVKVKTVPDEQLPVFK